MSTSPDTFDPLAVVVDWLDAGRSGNLDALLDLYEEGATLHCLCENATLVGRKSFAAYWAPKLKNKLGSAFTLDEVVLFGNIVQSAINPSACISVIIHISVRDRLRQPEKSPVANLALTARNLRCGLV